MIKTIMIGDKPYEMKSNLRIYETYKNMFGKELAPTIVEINKELKKIELDNENNISIMSSVAIECIKIAWIMIKELNNNFMSLEDWQEELDSDLIGGWVTEVIELAFSPFHGRKLPQDHKQSTK